MDFIFKKINKGVSIADEFISNIDSNVVYIDEKKGILECNGLLGKNYKVVDFYNNQVVGKVESESKGKQILNNYISNNSLCNEFVLLDHDKIHHTINISNKENHIGRKRISIIFINESTTQNGEEIKLEDCDEDNRNMKFFFNKYGFSTYHINVSTLESFDQEIETIIASIRQIQEEKLEVVFYIKSLGIEKEETQLILKDGNQVKLSEMVKRIKTSYINKKSSTIIIPDLYRLGKSYFKYGIRSEVIPEDTCYIIPTNHNEDNCNIQFIPMFIFTVNRNPHATLQQIGTSVENLINNQCSLFGNNKFSCKITSSINNFTFDI